MTNQAQVAKLIRQHLKAIGLKGRVTSKGYAGGDSVRVVISNQAPAVKKQLQDDLGKYQYGHFDGMTDMYEYSNTDGGIPQTKFLFIDNDHDDESRQKAWDYIRANFSGADDHPEKLEDVPPAARVFGEWATTIVHRVLCGSDGDFWN